MDFITSLLPSLDEGIAFDSILIVVDRFTKFAKYIPMNKTIITKQLALVFEKHILSEYSALTGIVSDYGPVFTSHF